MEIKNRFVRSATFEGMATEDGYITDNHIRLYKELAEGGVGLIITGYSYVKENGKSFHKQTGVSKDDFIPGLKRIAKTNEINQNSST